VRSSFFRALARRDVRDVQDAAGKARTSLVGLHETHMPKFQLLEYQDEWPFQFQLVATELIAVFPSSSVAVEHIGSTAVPGLCAKPVLDVLVGVDSLRDAEEHRHDLAALGYAYRGEYEARLPGRRYFVRAEGPTLRVHVHCVVRHSSLWQQHMEFRDVLRRSPALRREYAALKRSLATVHAEDKSAYTEAKAPFIQRVLAAATRSA
jgi:GrpB-like predicted nucleotidyltransferase (UPF0157 family)